MFTEISVHLIIAIDDCYFMYDCSYLWFENKLIYVLTPIQYLFIQTY